MSKKTKLTEKDRDSLVQVLIAFSQVTFGVAWGAVFLSVDQYKPFVILLNLVITILFILIIRWLNRL